MSPIIKTSVRALRRNVTRSILTCLGIIIGIAAVIAMVEIGQGTSHTIAETIAKLGANVVQIDPSDVVKAAVHSGTGGRVTLVPADADAIARECPGVRWAAASVDCGGQLIYQNRNYRPRNILGTVPDYLKVRDWQFADGAAFTEEDVRRSATVCLLGQQPARWLFGDESPVGKEVRMGTVELKVVGLLAAKGSTMDGRDMDDVMLVPWTTVKYRLQGQRQSQPMSTDPVSAASTVNTLKNLYPGQQNPLYPVASAAQLADIPMLTRFTDLDDIFVSADSPEDVSLVTSEVTALLRERHKIAAEDPDDFRIRDLTEISERLASTTVLMTRLLLCVATISLIVGGVGIMNIMLVSVTERTREIGLRMAVGARRRDIMRQFLFEAAMLCLAGGVVGIALGRGASIIVTSLLHWPTQASLPAIVAAVGVSVLVGITFGYYPAWKASRLDPIDALRAE